MDDFDEFEGYSLPSDPPTNLDAIAVVREAAAKDPKIRHFLQRIRSKTESASVRASIRQALAQGHPGIGSFKDLVIAKQENENARKRAEASTAAVEEMAKQVSQMSIQRDNLLRRIEDLNHNLLLTTSINNHQKYEIAREEKYKSTLEKLHCSKPATMQEAEQMLNAAQYDMQAGKTVNLDRIVEHRKSILDAIKERTKRDSAVLSALSIPDKDKGQKVLDDITTRAKLEVLQHAKLIEEREREIAVLKSKVGTPTEAAKVHAMKQVHTRLLQILEDLVPEGAQEIESKADDVEDEAEIEAKIEEQMRLARGSIATYNARVKNSSSADEVNHPELEENLKKMEEVEARGLSVPEVWKSFSARTVVGAPNVTDSIMSKAREIADLDIKIKNDQVRSQVSNLHSIQTVSSNLLFQKFSKASLESPLLADQDLYGVKTVSDLSRMWHDESLKRQAVADTEHSRRIKEIERHLNQIQVRLDDGQTLLDDVNSLPNLGEETI